MQGDNSAPNNEIDHLTRAEPENPPDDPPRPRVFISYSHDSEAHNKQVRAFAVGLREQGVDARLDQFEMAPPEGWPRWCTRQILEANYVLLICTAQYAERFLGLAEFSRGRGVKWEGKVIQNILYYSEINTGFIPVIFSKAAEGYIPITVKDTSWFLVDESPSGSVGYAALLVRLTSGHAFSPLGVPEASPDYLRTFDASVPQEEGWEQSQRIQKSLADLRSSQERQYRNVRWAVVTTLVCLLLAGGVVLWKLYGLKTIAENGRDFADQTRRLMVGQGVSEQRAREILATQFGLTRDQIDAKLKEFKAAAEAGKTKNPLDPARAAFADRRYNDSAQLAEHVAYDIANARQEGKAIRPEEEEVELEGLKLLADSYGASNRYVDELAARRRLIDAYGSEYGARNEGKMWPWLEANAELANTLATHGDLNSGRAKIDFVLGIAGPALEKFNKAGSSSSAPESDLDPRVLYLSFRNIRSLIARNQGDARTQLDDSLSVWDMSRDLYGKMHNRTLIAGSDLAIAYNEHRQFDKALEIEEQVITILKHTRGPDDLQTLMARLNHAATMQEAKRVDEALKEDQFLVEKLKSTRGPDAWETLKAQHNLANAMALVGRYPEAEELHRTVLQARIRLAPKEADTFLSRGALARVLQWEGRFLEAEKEARQANEFFEGYVSPTHPSAIGTRSVLIGSLLAQHKYDEVVSIERRTIDILDKTPGTDISSTLTDRNDLALALNGLKRFSEAEEIHRRILEVREQTLGPKNPETLSSRFNVGFDLANQNKFDEAAPVLNETLILRREVLGGEHPRTISTQLLLAYCLCAKGEQDAAASLYREIVSHGPALPEQQRLEAQRGLESCLHQKPPTSSR